MPQHVEVTLTFLPFFRNGRLYRVERLKRNPLNYYQKFLSQNFIMGKVAGLFLVGLLLAKALEASIEETFENR